MAARRLLIVNPNTDMRVTGWLAAEARRVAGPACAVDAVNAASGLAAITTPSDLRRATRAVADAVAARPWAEAVLVAAFGDPGLAEVRLRDPSRTVAGLGEAGLRAVAAGGRPFAVVTLGAAMEAPLRARLAAMGLADRLAGLTILPTTIEAFVASRQAWADGLDEAVRRAFGRGGVDAVLLGGAPFAGLAAGLQLRLGRPVLDGVRAGVAALLAR